MKPEYLKNHSAESERHYVQLMIFVCSGLLLYFKTFAHTWTFDDYFVVLGNQDIRSLKDFVANEYPGRPLRELSFMLDYKIFGLAPKYWHFQNILIHSLNAWLIYVILMKMSASKPLSWLSSLIFLTHPINVEVVAQVSHRKDSLCLLFILIAFCCYVNYRQNQKTSSLVTSILAFVLSLLSKQSALVLPAIIILYEFYVLKSIKIDKLKHGRVFISAISIVLMLLFAFIWSKYFDSGARELLSYSNALEGYSVGFYYTALLSSWGFIIAKLFWPFGLAVNYVIIPPATIYDHRLLLLLTFIVLALCLLKFAHRKSPLLLFFMLWFGVFFLPASNLLPLTLHFVADRYLYVSSVGFSVVLALIAYLFFPARHILITASMVLAFSWVTLSQVDVWKDNLSLWEHSLKYNPNSSRAMMNVALFKYHDNDEMFLAKTMKSIELNPGDPLPYNSLARYYDKMNKIDDAIEYYEKFISVMDTKRMGMYGEYYSRAKQRLADLQ